MAGSLTLPFGRASRGPGAAPALTEIVRASLRDVESFFVCFVLFVVKPFFSVALRLRVQNLAAGLRIAGP